MVTPIIVAGKHVGNVFIGQFFYDDEIPDVEIFREQARQYGFDETEYLQALNRVPRFSRDAVNAGMQFYADLTGIISTLSFNMLQQSRMIAERKRTVDALKESEQHFRSIVENSEAGYFYIDKEGIYKDVNNAWIQLYKYNSTDEIIGKHFAEIENINAPEEAKTFFNGIMQGDKKFMKGELSRQCKNGSIGFHSFSSRPITKEGKIIGIEGFIIDVTERKQAEEALRNSKAYLDSIIEHSPHAMWISDSGGTLIRLNQACRNLLHITDEEVVGKYNILQDTIVAEQGYLPTVKQVFEKRTTVNFTIVYNSEQLGNLELDEHTSLVLDVTISPVLDTDGNVIHAIVQHIDITERRRAEKEIQTERDFSKALLDGLPGIFYFYDSNFNFLRWNKNFETVSGYSGT